LSSLIGQQINADGPLRIVLGAVLFHYLVHHKPTVLENFIQRNGTFIDLFWRNLQIFPYLFAQSQIVTLRYSRTFGESKGIAVSHQTHSARLEEYDHAIRRSVILDKVVSFQTIRIERPIDFPTAAKIDIRIRSGVVRKQDRDQQQKSISPLLQICLPGFADFVEDNPDAL
jgi:hypothetical protein